MTKALLAFALAQCLVASAFAQTPTSSDAARGADFNLKVARFDDLIQIVPLALTKDEITPILTAIEKVRQKDRELLAQEVKDLAKYDAMISKALNDGIEKSIYPPRELQGQVRRFNDAVRLRRRLFYNDCVDSLFAVCKSTLNEGQLKAMEKSLSPEVLDPSLKNADMDSDAKIKFFIRSVLLDAPCYDVLLAMSRRKEDPAPATP